MLLGPPQNHHQPSAQLTPLPRPGDSYSPTGPASCLPVDTHAHPTHARSGEDTDPCPPPPAAGTRLWAVSPAHRPISWHRPTDPFQHPGPSLFPASPVAKSWFAAVTQEPIHYCHWPGLLLAVAVVDTSCSGFMSLPICLPPFPYPPSWEDKHPHSWHIQLVPLSRLILIIASLIICQSALSRNFLLMAPLARYP